MKIIKLIIAVSVFSLSSLTYSQNIKITCDVSWSAKVKGITVGKTEDKLTIRDNTILEINSVFTPGSALKIFGIKSIKRKAIFNGDGKIIIREEETVGNKVAWKKSDKENYQKFKDNDLVEEISIDINKKIIDSTIFPYLAFFNLLNKEESLSVFILGKSSLYQAIIKRQDKIGKDTLFFESDKSKGQVILDADKKPSYFTFSQDGNTLEASRTNWICSNN